MYARMVLPHGGRILITGSPTLQMAMDAINFGAVSRFFIKPFQPFHPEFCKFVPRWTALRLRD